jgi:hypothetical protein
MARQRNVAQDGSQPAQPVEPAVPGLDLLPEIIPWGEVNYPETYYDRYVKGVNESWGKVCKRVICTTDYDRALKFDLYRKLREEVDLKIGIIPGLKTWYVYEDCQNAGLFHGLKEEPFTCVPVWSQVGRSIDALADRTGARIVVIENEIAQNYHVRESERPLDKQEWEDCLNCLPRDLEYWWWNGVYPPYRERSVSVCRIIENVLNVRFFDLRCQSAVAAADVGGGYSRAREALLSFAVKPSLPIQYFYGRSFDNPEHEYWQDAQVCEALQFVLDEWGDEAQVVPFPGIKYWDEQAAVLTKEVLTCARRLAV